jgi:ribosomal protein L32
MLLFKATVLLSAVTLALGFFEWKNCGKYALSKHICMVYLFCLILFIAIETCRGKLRHQGMA